MKIDLRILLAYIVMLFMCSVQADTEVNGSDNPLDNPEVSCGCDVKLPKAVLVNKDDDNENSSPDSSDTGPITGETDLCMGKLTAFAKEADGVLTLKIMGNVAAIGGKIWKDAQKSEELSQRTWVVPEGDPFEVNFWIEGVQPSASLDDVVFEAKIICGDKSDTDLEKTTSVDVDLKSVSFSGNKYHELINDQNNKTYSKPHWFDANLDGSAEGAGNPFGAEGPDVDHNYSIAYTRNTKPTLGAQFIVRPQEASALVSAIYESNKQVKITEEVGLNGMGIFPDTESKEAWEDEIRLYSRANKDFEVTWTASVCEHDSVEVAQSITQVYLTYRDPKGHLKSPTLIAGKSKGEAEYRETFFHLACERAEGKGSATELIVANSIYTDFLDQSVYKINPITGVRNYKLLEYYPVSGPFGDFVVDGDGGACGGWARFLVNLWATQGLDGSYRELKAKVGIKSGAPDANNSVIQVFYPSGASVYKASVNYSSIMDPHVDSVGTPCQGGTTASSTGRNVQESWSSQAIASFTSPSGVEYFYDPSYGSVLAIGVKNLNFSLGGFGGSLPDQIWKPHFDHLEIAVK